MNRIVFVRAWLLICCSVVRADCLTGASPWQNTAISPQGGQFAVEFDATPSDANMDGITALSLGAGLTFDDYAILIRFYEGRIDVRNGSGYAFDVEVLYTVGSSHHIRAQIDVPNHVYSVWVTPPSGPEVKIATDYAFRDSQNTVESLDNWGIWSGLGALDVCNFGIAPMDPLGTLVTSAGLVLDNAELLWIRSHDPMDSVRLILGDSIQSVQQSADQWLYFVTAECLEWNGEATGCLASTMGLGMPSGVHYDLVAWTEAQDRRTPEREMVVIAEDWAFHPADINMDGAVDCADLTWFSSSPYDWNLDGEVTAADLNEVGASLSAVLADIDGDGMVDITDLLELLGSWGPCPPAGECVGDLDCDGMVGIQDALLSLILMGL